jgi:hypothetical protein
VDSVSARPMSLDFRVILRGKIDLTAGTRAMATWLHGTMEFAETVMRASFLIHTFRKLSRGLVLARGRRSRRACCTLVIIGDELKASFPTLVYCYDDTHRCARGKRIRCSATLHDLTCITQPTWINTSPAARTKTSSEMPLSKSVRLECATETKHALA